MAQPTTPIRRGPLIAAAVLAVVVFACSIHANLSFAITNPSHYRYLPPFKPFVNDNANHHLGGEYFNIAQALAAGEGFANPFPQRTGPTAWQPPVYPVLLAALLWVSGDDKDAVVGVVVFLQVLVLIGTGFLVLALTLQTSRRLGSVAAIAVFFLGLFSHYHFWFQITHDGWIVLLTLDLLVAGLCWFRPLGRRRWAIAWGLLGGLCALTSPIVAFAWGTLTLVLGICQRAWSSLTLAVLIGGLTVAPWTMRNYLVFGRLIPMKSNLAFELYQSQCLQPDGLLQNATFRSHPYRAARPEGQEYRTLGETAFLDRKREQFWQAVWADPLDFFDRVAGRFLGATLWYVPFDRTREAQRPVVLWLCRLTHPLPFLALLVLVFTALRERLTATQWSVIGVYLLYLLPYVGTSYYERYAVPLLGAKALLTLWGADRLLSAWPGKRSSSPGADSQDRAVLRTAAKRSVPSPCPSTPGPTWAL